MRNHGFLFCLGAWIIGAAAPAPRTEVSLCADVWCPYNCEPGAPLPGFAIEIARDVFGQAGYRVTYRSAGWARCIEDTRAGRYSAIVGAVHADAPDFIYPRVPIGVSTTGLAVRKGDTFRFAGAKSFDGRVLGTVRGYEFGGETGDYLRAHADDEKRVEFVAGDGSLRKNLVKLLAGRLDVVVDDGNVMRSTVDSLGLGGEIRVEDAPGANPHFIAFSPAFADSTDLARILDQGIAAMRADGRLAAIMARYHLREGS